MSRPRVLHIGKFYPPYKGGMETHLQQLCRAIQHEMDLEVIVANDSSQTIHECDGNIRLHRLGTLVNIASAPICPGLVKTIRRTPADIIHLHCPNPTAVMALRAARHPAKLVFTHHSDVIRQTWLKLAYEPWSRWLTSRASRIIVFSPNYIESSPTLTLHCEKCEVISHGIDLAEFEDFDSETVSKLRAKFGPNMVLGVGRLVYYKGFEYLIRAVAQTDATLVIVGTGPLHDKLHSLADDLHIADRVHLLGEVDDVRPYYRAAKVFALPSVARSEAFGIVQLEAMACGTPVINTALDTGVPFVSVDNVSGLTIPPADSDKLRDAIQTLLSNDELHRRLSLGAVNRVRENFTMRTMAEKTLKLYEDVLSETADDPKTKTATLVG